MSSTCQNCKRKSLIKILCKCDKTVCINCRYPEKHTCVFDFKKEGKELLQKNNPVVIGEKLDRV